MLIRLVMAYHPMVIVTAESSSLQDHRGGGIPGRQPIGECVSPWLFDGGVVLVNLYHPLVLFLVFLGSLSRPLYVTCYECDIGK